jgi:hypothetical protein
LEFNGQRLSPHIQCLYTAELPTRGRAARRNPTPQHLVTNPQPLTPNPTTARHSSLSRHKPTAQARRRPAPWRGLRRRCAHYNGVCEIFYFSGRYTDKRNEAHGMEVTLPWMATETRASTPVFARSLDQVLRPRRRHHGASCSWALLADRHGSRCTPTQSLETERWRAIDHDHQ